MREYEDDFDVAHNYEDHIKRYPIFREEEDEPIEEDDDFETTIEPDDIGPMLSEQTNELGKFNQREFEEREETEEYDKEYEQQLSDYPVSWHDPDDEETISPFIQEDEWLDQTRDIDADEENEYQQHLEWMASNRDQLRAFDPEAIKLFNETMKENIRRKNKYPKLEQIDIDSLKKRFEEHFSASTDDPDREEKAERLRNDLLYSSAGFERGSKQVYEVANGERRIWGDPFGWGQTIDIIKKKLEAITPEERRMLINNMYEQERIDSYTRDQLLVHFVEDQL